MNRSSYLDPSAIQNQCENAIQILNSDIDALQMLDHSLDGFATNNEIMSKSFNTLKQQLGDYKTVTQAICMAHESDKMDYESLKGAVAEADGVLDGNIIITNMEKAKEDYEENLRKEQEYRAMASSTYAMLIPGVMQNYLGMAQSQMVEAEKNKQIYEEWKLKEETYDNIGSATNGLFSASAGMRSAINSAIEGIAGSFSVYEGAYVPNINALWRSEIDNARIVMVEQQLKKEGIEEKEIQNMIELGFTYEQVWRYYQQCITQQDKEFFKQLLIGTEESYIRAFQINPDEITGGMTIFMADYSSSLLNLNDTELVFEGESTQQVTQFNNAVLAAESAYLDQQGNLTNMKYRDVYLERLNIATQYLLYKDAEKIALSELVNETDKSLYQKYDERKAMAMLWASESVTMQKLRNCSYEAQDHRCQIVDLNYTESDLTYKLEHYSPFHQENVYEEVEVKYYQDPTTYNLQDKIEQFKKFEEAQDNLMKDFSCNLIKNAAKTLISSISPEMAMVISLTSMIENGAAGSITGLDSLASTEVGKLALNEGNIVVADSINACVAWCNLQTNMDDLNKQDYLEMFGSFTTYSINGESGVLPSVSNELCMSGVYDPDILGKKIAWERQGVDAWLNYGYAQNLTCAEDIMREIDVESIDEDTIKVIKSVLFGQEGMFETIPMNEINIAISEINRTIIKQEGTEGEGNEMETLSDQWD